MRIRQPCRRRYPSTRNMHRRRACRLLGVILASILTADCWLPPSVPRVPQTLKTYILLHAKREKLPEDDPKQEGDRISVSQENVNNNSGDEGQPGGAKRRLPVSNKDQAISELDDKKEKAMSALSQPNDSGKNKSSKRTTMRRSKKQNQNNSSLLPPPESKKRSTRDKKQSISKRSIKESSFTSLLPPPLPSVETKEFNSLSSGLSSWEEFLGRAEKAEVKRKGNDNSLIPRPGAKSYKKKNTRQQSGESLELPSISDLFPADLTSKKESPNTSKSQSSLDGVLPVSELFYRSSQAITGEEREGSDTDDMEGDEGDDEELPFSAEQSDELITDDNRVKIRRNRAETTPRAAGTDDDTKSLKKKNKLNKRNRGRKLVRRGMEMFLGGTPINADPPQRSLELTYTAPCEEAPYSWASAITLNTEEFGPLLRTGSVESVNLVELGLYCENFVSAALKWDVCPQDLRELVKSYTLQQEAFSGSFENSVDDSASQSSTDTGTSSINVQVTIGDSASDNDDRNDLLGDPEMKSEVDNILSLLRGIDEAESVIKETRASIRSKKENKRITTAKGFGKKPKESRGGQKGTEQRWTVVGFALKFSIGVSKEELESGDSRDKAGSVMRGVLTRGITTFLKSQIDDLQVRINTLKLQEGDDGATNVVIEFSLDGKGDVAQGDMEKLAAPIDAALCQAMHDGEFALALATAAKEETAWPEAVRDRVVEEFLLEDDDVHTPWEDSQSQGVNGSRAADSKSASSQTMPFRDKSGESSASQKYAEDDIFGNEGVFFDCSESNAANSPFKGALGPILVEAVTARAVERPPRIIAIGDVHGCIHELQDLVRLCDYRPGDQIIFLGDLVSKGPDSISVVQMAREIGAIGVRGNHDFEVIRWHQAIKAGIDPPVVGSEHFHIASCLSAADLQWMYRQPWYMTSKDLGTSFVHAGFVSGIRLSKQNPRLMMNMRSILPDGTVTSKFFNNWPWARLWDGPQTILFGHDADRGLQQYEHAIGLDTGCVYGGRLTACILPEKRLLSVNARREYFKYRRKHYD